MLCFNFPTFDKWTLKNFICNFNLKVFWLNGKDNGDKQLPCLHGLVSQPYSTELAKLNSAVNKKIQNFSQARVKLGNTIQQETTDWYLFHSHATKSSSQSGKGQVNLFS